MLSAVIPDARILLYILSRELMIAQRLPRGRPHVRQATAVLLEPRLPSFAAVSCPFLLRVMLPATDGILAVAAC